jgi:hypothetical protein
MDWVETDEAIGGVDELLAGGGLGHGKRKTLAGTWKEGERRAKLARIPVEPSARPRIFPGPSGLVRVPALGRFDSVRGLEAYRRSTARTRQVRGSWEN